MWLIDWINDINLNDVSLVGPYGAAHVNYCFHMHVRKKAKSAQIHLRVLKSLIAWSAAKSSLKFTARECSGGIFCPCFRLLAGMNYRTNSSNNIQLPEPCARHLYWYKCKAQGNRSHFSRDQIAFRPSWEYHAQLFPVLQSTPSGRLKRRAIQVQLNKCTKLACD